MKKLLIALGVILVLLLGALVAIPYFFKDDIVAAVKQSANENLTATLEFDDVDISVFRHFPKLTLGLDHLKITNGPGPFEGVRLVDCERLDVAVSLWSAIFSETPSIEGIHFKKPIIKVYVLSNGAANYDITKPDPTAAATTSTESSGAMRLEKYSITDGSVLYDDRGLDMVAQLDQLNHEGSGEFTSDIFDLAMKTHIGQLSVNYGGVQYLSKANTLWDATLEANLSKMRFELHDNTATINNLKLNVDGWLEMPNDVDMLMDIKFGSPDNTLKSWLSIVPGAYTQDFEQVKANGTVQFSGFVKGRYNETIYPAFNINMKVNDGSVQYPTLPLGIAGILVDATVNSPSANLDAMTVQIPKFALRIGSNPIEGHFNLKTPVSDPNVDTRVKGVLNLAELSKAFPMEGVKEMAGIIRADITTKATMSQIDQGRYESVNVAGQLAMENVAYHADGSPKIKINTLQTSFSPQRVDVPQFDAKLGNSDLRASGSIDNVLAWFSPQKTMTGRLNFASNFFDANEWVEPTPADEAAAPNDVPAETAGGAPFDRWDFTMDGKIGRLNYDTYKISDMLMQGHFTPNSMNINQFGLRMGESDLTGNGKILNAWNYLFNNQTVTGVVNLNSNYFDLNQFMEPAPAGGAATTAETPATGTIPVPENMDMTLNANFNKVTYTNLTLTDLNGAVGVKDEVASLQNMTVSTLGGQMALKGEYNTKDAAKPVFNMDMALQNMGFKDAFQYFVTVKKLAPIAQLMEGKFNTTLSMTGIMGQDMTPDFTTLTAAGFLETLSAVVNNFKPMQVVGEKLNVDYLKRLELMNTKNWFEINNGQVEVKPFDVKVRDRAMRIGGTHGISNEMNYQIFTKAPRKALGQAANGGITYLSQEASRYGVNIAQGEYINVRFDLTGSLFNPKVSFKVLGSDGKATIEEQATATAQAYADKARDSVTNVANRELDKAKEQAKKAADKAADTISKVVDKKIDEAANRASEVAKDEVGKVLGNEVGNKVGDAVGNKVGEKAGEVVGDKGKKTVDEAKKKLDQWDPFGKKKKN